MDTVSMLEIKARPGNAVRLMHIQEVVGRVVTLLNDADRELGQTQEAAKSSIAREKWASVRYTSVLRSDTLMG